MRIAEPVKKLFVLCLKLKQTLAEIFNLRITLAVHINNALPLKGRCISHLNIAKQIFLRLQDFLTLLKFKF